MASVHRVDGPGSHPGSRAQEPLQIVPFDRRQRRSATGQSPLVLARLIEGEIIPRLLVAHQSVAKPAPLHGARSGFCEQDVTGFVALVLVQETDALVLHIDALLGRGFDIEGVLFDLLSPTAKTLGRMWEDDLCSFTDVTIGLCRLHQIVYELGARTPVPSEIKPRRNALFALTPGDDHSFGLVLVSEHFRRSGWQTVSAPEASLEDLEAIVASEAFDLIGFSMSDDKWLDGLPAVITALRIASLNPAVRVIVGGRVFSDHPELTEQVGADATAEDARQAVLSAEGLVERPSRLA